MSHKKISQIVVILLEIGLAFIVNGQTILQSTKYQTIQGYSAVVSADFTGDGRADLFVVGLNDGLVKCYANDGRAFVSVHVFLSMTGQLHNLISPELCPGGSKPRGLVTEYPGF